MKRFLLVSCLLAAGLIVPAAGHAQAATCTWQRTELPSPEPRMPYLVAGVRGDYVLAHVGQSDMPGILWHKGNGRYLAPPSADPAQVSHPSDVNGSGTVTGTLDTYVSGVGTVRDEAYVTRLDGTHQLLASVTGFDFARAINDRGDVVGSTNVFGQEPQIVLWSGTDYTKYRILGPGRPEGIDNHGRVATTDGRLITPLDNGLAIGRRLQVPPGTRSLEVFSFEDGVPAGYVLTDTTRLAVVWNTTGSIRWTDNGEAFAGNRSGSAIGLRGQQQMYWRAGHPVGWPAPGPAASPRGVFLSSTEIITGMYLAGTDFVAAQWRCV